MGRARMNDFLTSKSQEEQSERETQGGNREGDRRGQSRTDKIQHLHFSNMSVSQYHFFACIMLMSHVPWSSVPNSSPGGPGPSTICWFSYSNTPDSAQHFIAKFSWSDKSNKIAKLCWTLVFQDHSLSSLVYNTTNKGVRTRWIDAIEEPLWVPYTFLLEDVTLGNIIVEMVLLCPLYHGKVNLLL